MVAFGREAARPSYNQADRKTDLQKLFIKRYLKTHDSQIDALGYDPCELTEESRIGEGWGNDEECLMCGSQNP